MTRSRSWRRLTALALALAAAPVYAQELRLPNKGGSCKFAVIGDTGTGAQAQYDVGKQMAAFHDKFKYEFVIMVGDNIYGSDSAGDFQRKFELPYKALLDARVKFYASLGNHDDATQNAYQFVTCGRQRSHTLKPENDVRVCALGSNYLNKPQLEWVEKEMGSSKSEWKIAYCHHPL